MVRTAQSIEFCAYQFLEIEFIVIRLCRLIDFIFELFFFQFLVCARICPVILHKTNTKNWQLNSSELYFHWFKIAHTSTSINGDNFQSSKMVRTVYVLFYRNAIWCWLLCDHATGGRFDLYIVAHLEYTQKCANINTGWLAAAAAAATSKWKWCKAECCSAWHLRICVLMGAFSNRNPYRV